MLLSDVWALLQERVFPELSTDALFNPYRDRHQAYDRPEAPSIRRENLRRYLSCFEADPALLLIAEAPGPWGCRFSGVPFVSESQLADGDFPIDGALSSAEVDLHSEQSASIVWRVLGSHFPHFFLWNSLPYHPHDPGDPLTIRTPRRSEVAAYEGLLAEIVERLNPERVVAVGRKGERALDEIGVDNTYVRHPSHGGANKFEAGMLDILEDIGLR